MMRQRGDLASGLGGACGWLVTVAVCFILVFPGLVLIPMSFTAAEFLTLPPRGYSLRWYADVLQDARWRAAIGNSLIVAVGAAGVALIAGVPAAVAFRRLSRRLFSDEAVASLPLLIPTVVLGIGLYRWYLQHGWVGSRLGLVFAHAVLGTPLVILTVLATLRRIDPELENAAFTLGANRWKALWTVTVPLAMPGIVAGGLFAFITSFDEVALAFFLTDAGMKTLPKVLYDEASYLLRPSLAAASTLLILVSAFFAAVAMAASRPRHAGIRR